LKEKGITSEDDDFVLGTVDKDFGGTCYYCGEKGHKKAFCPKKDSDRKIGCKHCGLIGHKNDDCWSLEKNKSKRPEWWNEEKHGKKEVGTAVVDIIL